MKREYPKAPIVAVGVIIRSGDRIALIQRDKEPSKGLWTFPGGAVELGETVRDAAQREALEETGLAVELGEVAAVVDNMVHDEEGRIHYHYIILDFFARPAGGRLQPGTDVSDARWASLADLDSLDMTEKAGQLARELLAGPAPDIW
ncbi:NUDIX hydrolase [Chloroflexota bacterium]